MPSLLPFLLSGVPMIMLIVICNIVNDKLIKLNSF